MRIDYIWFFTPLMPFALYLWARVFWFFIGNEWVSSIEIDAILFVAGLFLGATITLLFVVCDFDLGGFDIKAGRDK